ncbi:CD63 antigen-like [Tenebrio molitor]|uniref:CD63 antigen-like n=1 Tax=Tenebrio molitor TaxID=7067 RepID=UPI00362492E0
MSKTSKLKPSQDKKSSKIPTDSDSFTSLFISWQKNKAPPIYPNAQTGRIVTTTEFSLFYVAVILLVLVLGLGAASIWSLCFRSYTLLGSTELAYFALPAALLCLPCSWIVLSVHNDEKSRRFLSLVLILLTFSIVLVVIGVYIGFTHKLHLNSTHVERSPVMEKLRGSLRESMDLYRQNSRNKRMWDETQSSLECCGVDNYTDWFPLLPHLPESCCGKTSCQNNSTSSKGCLKVIAATLALQTCLFSGINCVALFVQCCAFVIVSTVYFCGKRHTWRSE